MKFISSSNRATLFCACFTLTLYAYAVVARDVAFNLGYIQIDLRSTESSPTRELLHRILSTTTDYVSVAFDTVGFEKQYYNKVATSIISYEMGANPLLSNSTEDHDDSTLSPFTAQVTITGQVYFNNATSWIQENITRFVSSIFDAEDNKQYGSRRTFFQELNKEEMNVSLPFLANLTYVSVRVDGDIVNEEDAGGSGDKTDIISNNSDNSDPALDVWMIALIGGFGAFLLVLCLVVTCICFIPIDDINTTKIVSNGKQSQNHLGQDTTNPTRSESKMEENVRREDDIDMSPSEAKSIGSQDSSLFTYNPKSVRSYDSKRSYSSYFTYGTQGVEMDVANWHASTIVSDSIPDPHYNISNSIATDNEYKDNQGLFDHDISAIEQKKCDLSQIQEDEENESTINGSVSVASSADVVAPLPLFLPHHSEHDDSGSNTVSVTSQSPSRASGKYKSLLATLTHSKSNSTTPGQSQKSIAQQYLQAAAKQDIKKHEEINLIEVYSRDSQSTDSGSESSSRKMKSNGALLRPLSTALAAGPPSNVAQHHPTDPMSIYSNNATKSSNPHIEKSVSQQPSDEESETDDTESSYGPSYIVPQPRLQLGGTAADVLNDLHDLSTQINEIRNSVSSSSSTSGKAAIRNRR